MSGNNSDAGPRFSNVGSESTSHSNIITHHSTLFSHQNNCLPKANALPNSVELQMMYDLFNYQSNKLTQVKYGDNNKNEDINNINDLCAKLVAILSKEENSNDVKFTTDELEALQYEDLKNIVVKYIQKGVAFPQDIHTALNGRQYQI